jgi:very-short-patch-repair endonuclease
VYSAERENRAHESLHELIARQHGLITAGQAAALRVSTQAIARRVASGEWARTLPRVYRVTVAPMTSRQSALAAVLWAGEGALLSHASAAMLWEFDGVRTGKIELSVPRERNIRSKSVVIHRSTRLDRADRTVLEGIRITTPARTLIDMSGRLEDHRLSTVLEDLIRRDLVSPERLGARLSALRSSGRPGGGRLDELLVARGGGRPMESALETLVWPLILRAEVPSPVRQHWLVIGGDRYRLDFAWPDAKVALECDGYAFHGGRGAWNNAEARLAEFAAVGWRVLPVTWDAAKRQPERVIRWLRTSLRCAA